MGLRLVLRADKPLYTNVPHFFEVRWAGRAKGKCHVDSTTSPLHVLQLYMANFKKSPVSLKKRKKISECQYKIMSTCWDYSIITYALCKVSIFKSFNLVSAARCILLFNFIRCHITGKLIIWIGKSLTFTPMLHNTVVMILKQISYHLQD